MSRFAPIQVLVVVVLVVLAWPAMAFGQTQSTVPPGGGGYCTIAGSGSPGFESFTANITDTCGYAARAYCKYYTVDTGYGSVIYTSGTSKAYCSGITEYGWQENDGYGWITHRLG